MRRALAITLLIAFGFPLAQPLLATTADPDSQLPACCRRHGTHHCGMRMAALLQMMSGTPSVPAFEAPPCPYYPTAATLPTAATASLETSLPRLAELLRTPAQLPSANTRRAQTFTTSANLKRGPPMPLTV